MHTTRESWLVAALPALQSVVFTPVGLTVPSDVKVSCSWPGGGSAHKRIGECWPRQFSTGGVNEIFISPSIDLPVAALDILTHELIHAIDDCKSGHRGPFKRMARLVGLEGKATATYAGPVLRAKLEGVASALGPYPHHKLNLSGRKKQSTRNLKCACQDADCGAVWRMTAQWIAQAEGGLLCPVCHGPAAGGEE